MDRVAIIAFVFIALSAWGAGVMSAFSMKKTLSLIALLAIPQMALAWQWRDLWWRHDQQAMQLFEKKEYPQAAAVFDQKNWQGAAHYRANNFDQAASQFAQDHSAVGHYNYGNALAQQEKWGEALKAYEQALKIQPNFPDAQFNHDKVKEALQEQQKNKNEKSAVDPKSQPGDKNKNKSGSDGKQQQNNSVPSADNNKGQYADNAGQDRQGDEPSAKPNESQEKRSGKDSGNTAKDKEPSAGKQPNSGNEQPVNNNRQNYPENDQGKKPDTTAQNAAPKDNPSQQSPEKKELARAEAQKKDARSGKLKENESDAVNGEQQASDQQQQQKEYSLQQWLQQIPDDPAGLLRRKFLRDHQRRQYEQNDDSS